MAKDAAGNTTAANTCTCDSKQLTGGICFSSASDIEPDDSPLYEVTFKSATFESAYFYEHIRAAHGMCQPKFGNLTACQLLGNLCTLLLYKSASSRESSACKLYQSFTQLGRRSTEWPVDMPWLYYEEDMGDKILEEINVRETYTFPQSRLDLVLITYALNGSYLGAQSVKGSSLQLCAASESVLDAALQFGTTYKKSCLVSVRSFWDENRYKPVFYDMYLQFEYQLKKKLYAIPLLIRNFNSHADNEDRRKWKLVRRFFLVDNVSGKEITKSSGASGQSQTKVAGKARAVRYVEKMVLNIELRDSSGQIYPPFLDITYSSADTDDYDADKKVQVSFEVTYRMNMNKYKRDKAISAGVLSACAVIYTVLQTWGWSKRAGKVAIDFITIIKFLMLFCGNIANMFCLILFGTALWWLIFFKRQTTVMLLLPTIDQESEFIAYLISTFILKAIHLLHMIINQVTVDIFLLDWERPHGKAAQATDLKVDGGQRSPVSIWRTCFIANEWNEIQTVRKVNNVVQIFTVIFFLHVIGFENIASRDPHSTVTLSDEEYRAQSSRILRFAIASCVYMCVALVQWLFYTLVYQRFIEDPVRQFVDLCSVTNTSMFILENSLYGYYIHGRSVHGCADTGMHEMLENLKREEQDLCGQRGLLPNTEQQTFQMAIPRTLRAQYDRILLPMNAPQHGAVAHAQTGGNNPSHLNLVTEKSVQAYITLSRFLQAFIDHSLHDIDYVVQDRMFIEGILNVEFRDLSDKGMFITDNGHSFDNVLFFGNERTLLTFDILLFCLVDVVVQNFILAGIVTFLVAYATCVIRDSLGQANLAKKTLVDRRFLI